MRALADNGRGQHLGLVAKAGIGGGVLAGGDLLLGLVQRAAGIVDLAAGNRRSGRRWRRGQCSWLISLLDLQQGLVKLVHHRQHARAGGIGLLVRDSDGQFFIQVDARIGGDAAIGFRQPVVLGGLVGGDAFDWVDRFW